MNKKRRYITLILSIGIGCILLSLAVAGIAIGQVCRQSGRAVLADETDLPVKVAAETQPPQESETPKTPETVPAKLEDMIRYENGDVYEGEIKHGIPHGDGKMTYANGDVYEGRWEAGIWKGKGIFTWHTGEVLEAEFTDILTGAGTVDYKNGQKYAGAVVNGIPGGKGTMYYADGAVFKGSFDGFAWTGKGTYTFSTGDIFSGTMTGEGSGYGTLYYTSGSTFIGSIVKLTPVGNGKIVYPDGGIYSGNVNGHFNWSGTGAYTYPDGAVFSGNMSGETNGSGTITYTNGAKYTGSVTALAPSGNGKIEYADGGIYDGGIQGHYAWKGAGIYTYPESEITFQGDMSGEGMGRGTIDYKDGNTYTGDVKALTPDGTGKIIYSNGISYEGAIKGHYQWSGKGRVTWPGGEVFDGDMTGEGNGAGTYTDVAGNTQKTVMKNWYMKIKANGRLDYEDKSYYIGSYYNDENGALIWCDEGTYTYSNGATFSGEMTGIGSGKGTLDYKDGHVYKGTLEEFAPAGSGKLIYPNGISYEGTGFTGHHTYSGDGVIIWPDGSGLTGSMDSSGNGSGMFKNSHGISHKAVMEGWLIKIYKNGLIDYGDGTQYEGAYLEYADGSTVWDGQGIYTYANGATFTGLMCANGEGDGVLDYKDGHIFEGSIELFAPSGQGKLTYPNGIIYEGGGFYGHHLYSGNGTLFWPTGESFAGTIDYSGTGSGVYKDALGNTQNTIMQNWWLKIMTEGTISYDDGSSYAGRYYVDAGGAAIWEGHGIFTYAVGATFSGEMTGTGHGTGVLDYKNGHIYEGPIANLTPSGYGKLSYPNGISYEGSGFYDHYAFSGDGILRWPTGEYFTGTVDSAGNGKGIFTDTSGNSVEALLQGWVLAPVVNSIQEEAETESQEISVDPESEMESEPSLPSDVEVASESEFITEE